MSDVPALGDEPEESGLENLVPTRDSTEEAMAAQGRVVAELPHREYQVDPRTVGG